MYATLGEDRTLELAERPSELLILTSRNKAIF
jgi:hypothetical protein